MRVNAPYPVLLSKRLMTGFSISVVILAVYAVISSFEKPSDRDTRSKQMNLVIREVGHRLLQQAGDSTSRILPVTEIKDGTFRLRFDNEFVFSHDSLMAITKNLLPKKLFPGGYTVTVHDCAKGAIVYGFQFNNTSPDILACNGRSQPKGCYTIEFAFTGFYDIVNQQKAETDQPLVKNDRKPEAAKLTLAANDAIAGAVDPGSEKLTPNPGKGQPKDDYSIRNVVYGGIAVLVGLILVIGIFGKLAKPLSGQHQNLDLKENRDQALKEESVPAWPALGKFLFDVEGQRLLLGNEVINLTDKENKVLELLHKNFGELIPRETLLNEVWIKEGVITGRSLDMFVSKLRKRLSGDTTLRITNVHSKGYRLETAGEEQVSI